MPRITIDLPGSLLLLAFSLWGGQLHAADPVRVGLYQNPPKVFSTPQGRPAGFFIDILNTIADEEGWQLDYVPCDWSACLRALERGEIDLMPDVAYSSERDQRFDFHHEVVLSNWSLIYAPDRTPYHSIPDLDGIRIAVIAGSIQHDILKQRVAEFGVSPEFIELEDSEATLQAVAQERADVALINRLYGLQHAERYGLEPTHILVAASRLYYVTAEGRHGALLAAIDEHLGQMKADENSPYYRALSHWVEPLEEEHLPLWLLWLAEALAVLLLLLAVHSLILKRAIRRNTAELQKSNAETAESAAMFRSLFESSADAMMLTCDEELLDANPAMLRMFGYPDLESLRRIRREEIFPPQQPDGQSSREAALQHIRQAHDTGHAAFEWTHQRADGSLFPSEVTLVPMQVHGKPVLQATIRDISRRKQNESHLRQLNRALQTLSKTNHILVHARNEAHLLEAICRTTVEDGGYRLAWIGFAQYDDKRSVKPVAQYGFEEGYLETLRISWQDDEYGRGPTGTAIRTGKPALARDIHNDARFAPWREQAEQRGYASSIALPLVKDGMAFGALNIYSTEPDAFNEQEQELLMELADDIAFGIHNQRMRLEHTHIEEERKGHEEKLQHALLQTIQAISVMLEKRDPYTAGHQRRCADLAVAIGEELQLDAMRIEGIRFGSMIHDIGNIYVPAEILNRPGALSESERNIVRTHVQVGFDIIKDIDFPWPVAKMLFHHHERLDGSGYPEGLKGEEILLEARIIAVVDVVEAMLSHRPYRPAFGLEAALEELQRNRGIKYDERVVDACRLLFTEKGYTLPA